MAKALIILGTRPEAIKLSPVIRALRGSNLEGVVCNSGQQRDLCSQILRKMDIRPTMELDIMSENQDFFDLSQRLLPRLRSVLKETKPALVIVQGDTTTALLGAMSAAFLGIPVAHIEAGLRTRDRKSPFPEETNRTLIADLASIHFAPTESAKRALIRDGIADGAIFVTGNTAVDALFDALERRPKKPAAVEKLEEYILFTAHRRENFGAPLKEIFDAIGRFAEAHPQMVIVYPVHPNPQVSDCARAVLGSFQNIHLIPPVDYFESIALIRDCRFIVTDSGGIQEEAPYLGKPVVILRDTTERQEAIECGSAVLVGHDAHRIFDVMGELMFDTSARFRMMSATRQPFGDGTSARQIIETLSRYPFAT